MSKIYPLHHLRRRPFESSPFTPYGDGSTHRRLRSILQAIAIAMLFAGLFVLALATPTSQWASFVGVVP